MSDRPRGISVRELCDDQALGIALGVAAGASGLDRVVRSARIQKSGLALAGHFYGIEPGRIQIVGATEMTYLDKLGAQGSERAVRRFFGLDLCCVMVTECERTMKPPVSDALVATANELETPLLLSPERSSRTIVALHALLDERLAPHERVHGALVDVFEVGLLLLGESGVGKSEIALELVMRGHRLVADDVVECHYRPPGMVFGEAADLLRHHLEVRGLGILNIKDLFGVTSVRERKRVDVVTRLVDSPLEGDYDRLGLEQRTHKITGVDIPELLIPVRAGRDVATILEVAARTWLLKQAGYHPAQAFVARLETTLLDGGRPLPESAAWPAARQPRGRRGEAALEEAVERPPDSARGRPPRTEAAVAPPRVEPRPPESMIGAPPPRKR
jgi:HPr kinase/phosphorylase